MENLYEDNEGNEWTVECNGNGYYIDSIIIEEGVEIVFMNNIILGDECDIIPQEIKSLIIRDYTE